MTNKAAELKENNSTLLFTFSGTGNSLYIALKIQEHMENCEILSISKAYNEKKFEYKAARIGFIFPVYFLDAPHIVRQFLRNIKVIDPKTFLFAIANCGGEVGYTFHTISKILGKQNQKLNSEFGLVMPSNSIVMMDKTGSPEEVNRKLENAEQKINEIIEIIKNSGSQTFATTKVSFKNRFVSLMGKLFLFRIFNDRRYKVDEEKCTHCGTCVAVCPMNNIKLNNNKVTWSHNCECCAACLHWCPENAIQNMKTEGVPRYHHPKITFKQLKTYK